MVGEQSNMLRFVWIVAASMNWQTCAEAGGTGWHEDIHDMDWG